MIFEQIRGGFGANFTYIVADDASKEGVVIDPSGMTNKIMNSVDQKGIKVKYVINTHGHGDHIGGNAEIADVTGASIVKHASIAISKDVAVNDGDVLKIGDTEVKIIHTPGHSPDSICVIIGKFLFTGDTLFINECGRTDFGGGSSEQLWDSLFNKLVKLEDDLEVYPGHDYGPLMHDSLGNQKRGNYTLEPRTKEEFVKFMLEP
jgi:glyoxylase-like metal-dependent hydrolase (beta-lactamase superfamily II)